MKQVTLKQIAQRAGVSVGTVDRALNNRGRINSQTKENILKLAEEMGYQPNKIASALSRGKVFRIAVLYPKYPGYFVDELTDGLEKAIKYFSNYKIEVIPYRCDYLKPESQIEVIKNIDFSNIDGFALNASGLELSPYINEIAEKGIPVATFNSDITNSKRLFHVGMDPFLAGQVAGNLMGKMLNGKGKILTIPGFYSVLSHQDRILGFLDSMKQYPEIQILQEGEYLDKETVAEKLIEKIIIAHPDINGIYTVSSPGAIGAGWHLKNLPREKRPLLVGYDTNQAIRSLLKEDICTFVIYQNPASQIHYSLIYLVNYLMFGTLPDQETYFLPPQIVVKENIEYYLRGENKFTIAK